MAGQSGASLQMDKDTLDAVAYTHLQQPTTAEA